VPPLVAAIGALVTAFSATLAVALGSAAAAWAITDILVYAATSFLLNKAISALSPKPKTGAVRGLEVSITDSTSDGLIIYGKVRCGGVNVIPPLTSDTSGRYLHQCHALALHEVDSFVDVYFDQDQITTGSITAVTGVANDGLVTSGKYANVAWIRRYVGTSTDTADYKIQQAFASAFTSEWRGRGIAKAVVQFDWAQGKVYTGGVPVITYEVKGKKCYDPRLDTSPGANPNNTAYFAWTSNPMLIWADFMRADYGFAEGPTYIDWTNAAGGVYYGADKCDALVAEPTATTNKRYTFNGRLNANADPSDNVKSIVDSMLGKMARSGDVWRAWAGAWVTPEFTIEKEDWVSISAIQLTAPRDANRINGVAVYIVDPLRNWQRVESGRRYSDTYKNSDAGERIWLETDQPACTSRYEGQRKGEMLLRQSRNGVKVVGRLGPKYLKLRTWDNVSVNFAELGWVSKTFAVAHCKLDPTGGVEVVLTEEQSTDWADMVEADYATPLSAASLPTTNPTVPTEPQNFTVTPDFGLLKFDWDDPVVKPVGTRFRVLQVPGSASAVQSGVVVYDGAISDALVRVRGFTLPQWYHVQAYANTYFGPYQPNTFGIGAVPKPAPEDYTPSGLFSDPNFKAYASSYYWTGSAGGGVVFTNSGGLGQGGFVTLFMNSGNNGRSFLLSPINPYPPPLESAFANTKAWPCAPGQDFNVALLVNPTSTSNNFQLYAESFMAYTPSSIVYGKSIHTLAWDVASLDNTGNVWTSLVGSFRLDNSASMNYLYFQMERGGSGAVANSCNLKLSYFQVKAS